MSFRYRKRTLLVLLLLLWVAGGAIINVAVAWGCAMRPSRIVNLSGLNLEWPATVSTEWPGSPDLYGEVARSGYAAKTWTAFSERRMLVLIETGWPCRSLDRQSKYDYTSGQTGHFSSSLELSLPDFGRHTFPCRPIWRGFAINTIFYAAILWLLFAAPPKLRRWRRIKRGHCVQCNYNLRGNPTPGSGVCPECGAAVLARE